MSLRWALVTAPLAETRRGRSAYASVSSVETQGVPVQADRWFGVESARGPGDGDDAKLPVVFSGAGFSTYGEIARMRDGRGFHNQTHVVLSVA